MSNETRGVPEGTEIIVPARTDWHLHLRGGNEMRDVIGHTTRWAKRAVIMPNNPLIRTVERARSYREEILAAVPEGDEFEPLMTLCLTDNTPPSEIVEAKRSGIIFLLKAYAIDDKNNPDTGITSYKKIRHLLATAEQEDMPVSMHGEIIDPNIDTFNRTRYFVDRVLLPVVDEFLGLRITLEHLSTAYEVEFVSSHDNVFGTIAPHYLLANRNDLFDGGIGPDFYCSPILQDRFNQQALLEAATSGDPRFGLGTDSAPWGTRSKYCPRGKGGCFNAHAALEFYAEAFDSIRKVHMLGTFMSHGSKHYGLPKDTGTITLIREDWIVPESYPFGNDVVTPFRAGQVVKWKIKERSW